MKNKLQVMKYCLGLDFMIFVLIYEQLFHYSTLTLNAALATMSLINKTCKTIQRLEMIAEDRAERVGIIIEGLVPNMEPREE